MTFNDGSELESQLFSLNLYDFRRKEANRETLNSLLNSHDQLKVKEAINDVNEVVFTDR